MRMSMKVVAAAIALTATTGAFAKMTNSQQANTAGQPNGGGSELLFYVFNADTNQSYVRDLGVRVTNFASNSTSVPTDGSTYDIATSAPNGTSSFPGLYGSTPPGINTPGYDVHWTDQSLATLFGQAFTSSNTTWGVVAASSAATGARSLITSNDPDIVANATFSDGQTIAGNLDTFIGSFNTCPTCGIDPNILTNQKGTSSSTADAWNAVNLLAGINTPALTFNSGANVGVSQSFYSIANGSSGGIQAIYSGVWSLSSNGVLSYEVAPVPEPSTWAMLGAGLLLVGGIARRRLI